VRVDNLTEEERELAKQKKPLPPSKEPEPTKDMLEEDS